MPKSAKEKTTILHELSAYYKKFDENPAYFMSAFFHHPEDIAAEIKESGLILEKLLPVESLGGLLHNLEADWKDEERRKRLLKFLRLVENEPSLLGVSAHLIGIAKNQER
ncbi:MAG: hypothetical protein OEY18_06410 [Candidatus Aminicenantes bacterium]|nr:hypothetical protein [Candidatus Aminicenantes bacterium]MDH5384325.1 hypothetical protein [Candidatus Aminicenantes bacterium]MDH5744880.1 hypothetical protein [Candidatus Aminicenantes bacterium]